MDASAARDYIAKIYAPALGITLKKWPVHGTAKATVVFEQVRGQWQALTVTPGTPARGGQRSRACCSSHCTPRSNAPGASHATTCRDEIDRNQVSCLLAS